MDDAGLLQTFVESRSETAFAELVKRHGGLVYSTALRVTGDDQLARDVAQEAFIKLARGPGSVRNGNALPAWLYRVSHAIAVNAVASEARRRHREQAVVEVAEMEADPSTESLWTALKPSLDKAMGALSKTDQAALVLRFFADKSLPEVGQALGLSEEAARKRVGRALEKLRFSFAQRGLQVSSATLAILLAADAVRSAPAGLTATLATNAVRAAATTSSAGLFTVLSTALLTKTAAVAVVAVTLGAVITPLLFRKVRTAPPEQNVTQLEPQMPPPATPPAPSQTQPAAATSAQVDQLLARVAALPPLTIPQIETYVSQNRRNAESLLAAYRASADKTWLTEAATRFPNDPRVQYEVIASQATPDSQRQWIEAFKLSSPDNALARYFSALDYFKAREKDRAIQELAEATRKPEFRADLAPTLQALEELNINAGRAGDEAKVAAFQACAQFPHLPQMRELAKEMERTAQEYRNGGEAASAESIAAMGLVLGSHLSKGGGSQTLINQLVGIAIERMFLGQLGPGTTLDPLGRPIAEVSAETEQHQKLLKDFAQMMGPMMSRLDDTEWTLYMERVKLYGEEAALTWLKDKHAQQ